MYLVDEHAGLAGLEVHIVQVADRDADAASAIAHQHLEPPDLGLGDLGLDDLLDPWFSRDDDARLLGRLAVRNGGQPDCRREDGHAEQAGQ